MRRASSLGTVLHPARSVRHTHLPPPCAVLIRRYRSMPSRPSDQERMGTDVSRGEDAEPPAPPNSVSPAASKLGKRPGGFHLPDPAPLPLSLSSSRFQLVTQQAAKYPTGKAWQRLPLPIIHTKIIKFQQTIRLGGGCDDPFDDLDLPLLFDIERSARLRVDRVSWRRDLLRVLGNTQSYPQGWMAYNALMSIPFSIPHRHLNRLVRLMTQEGTKTRKLFGRMLSVFTSIHRNGWTIEGYQWNILIDTAGKGFRKAKQEDFKRAFDVFTDMVSARAPGATMSSEYSATWGYDEDAGSHEQNVLPDVYTYSTLINHAVNTRHGDTVRQSTSLLTASRLPPSRVTHLTLLKHHTNEGSLAGVRASLLKLREQKQELGIDGLNACMWAFSRLGYMEVALNIYRVLRHNMVAETLVGIDDIFIARRSLLNEGIEIPESMVPNEVTYTTVVQVAAYHGDLKTALTAFQDMLSSQNSEIGARIYRDEFGKLQPVVYSPTLPVFRAIFLGFSRHGVVESIAEETQPWDLSSLHSMFDVFLALPEHVKPNVSVLYWVLTAFDKTSSRDLALLRSVWTRLEDRFGENWGGTGHRLRRIRESLFPDGVSNHHNLE